MDASVGSGVVLPHCLHRCGRRTMVGACRTHPWFCAARARPLKPWRRNHWSQGTCVGNHGERQACGGTKVDRSWSEFLLR